MRNFKTVGYAFALVPILICNLVFAVLSPLLAAVAVFWFRTPDRLHFRGVFRYLEAVDVPDVGGDSYHREKAARLGADPLSDWWVLRWTTRNAFSAFNYRVCGVRDLPEWRESADRSRSVWVRPDGVPLVHWFSPLWLPPLSAAVVLVAGLALAPAESALWAAAATWAAIRFAGYRTEVYAGWAILGPQNGLCKSTVTIRLRRNKS